MTATARRPPPNKLSTEQEIAIYRALSFARNEPEGETNLYVRVGGRCGVSHQTVRNVERRVEQRRRMVHLTSTAYPLVPLAPASDATPLVRPFVYVPPINLRAYNKSAADWAWPLLAAEVTLAFPPMLMVPATAVLLLPMILAAVWLTGDIQAHYRRI